MSPSTVVAVTFANLSNTRARALKRLQQQQQQSGNENAKDK